VSVDQLSLAKCLETQLVTFGEMSLGQMSVDISWLKGSDPNSFGQMVFDQKTFDQ
jgi:hypothetical protein